MAGKSKLGVGVDKLILKGVLSIHPSISQMKGEVPLLRPLSNN